jgi:hypothetical protein
VILIIKKKHKAGCGGSQLLGGQRSGGSLFEASLGKKFTRHPSQPMSGWYSMCLSPYLTQEAETGRIMVLGQPRQKSLRPHFNRKKLGVVVHTCHLTCSRKPD